MTSGGQWHSGMIRSRKPRQEGKDSPARDGRVLCGFAFTVALACALTAPGLAAEDFAFTGKTTIHLASAEETSKLLSEKDAFIASMSPVDRMVRMNLVGSVPEDKFLVFLSKQALDFTADEAAKLQGIVASIRNRLEKEGLDLPFPPKVTLAKTTGKDEADAAYCRGPVIFLPKWFLEFDTAKLEWIVTHELFHVVSNCNRDLRPAMYAILGFQPCSEVTLPKEVMKWKITNPDSYENNFRIKVYYGPQTLEVIPVHMFSSEKYRANPRLPYYYCSVPKLLAVEERDGRWAPKLDDGEPVIVNAQDCADYYAKVARNSQYMMQPEEILAENFVLLVYGRTGKDSPGIPQKLREALTGDAPPAAEEKQEVPAGAAEEGHS